MEQDLLKALKKLHKSMEAQTKVLKRIEKSLRAVKTSEDEETIIDCGYGCTNKCSNCERKGYINKSTEPTGSKMFENLPEYQTFIIEQSDNVGGSTEDVDPTQGGTGRSWGI